MKKLILLLSLGIMSSGLVRAQAPYASPYAMFQSEHDSATSENTALKEVWVYHLEDTLSLIECVEYDKTTYIAVFHRKDDSVHSENLVPMKVVKWGVDPRPNPSISVYAAFANNPILFTDPNGDTIEVKGSKRFQNKVSQALGTISQTEAGRRIIETLQGSTNTYVIRRGDFEFRKNENNDGGTIYTSKHLSIPDFLSKFVHELGHGEDAHNGVIMTMRDEQWVTPDITENRGESITHTISHTFEDGTTRTKTVGIIDRAEASAMDKENKFRSEMGYPVRSHYGYTTFVTTFIVETSQGRHEMIKSIKHIDIHRVVDENGIGTHPAYRTDYNAINRVEINGNNLKERGRQYVSY